MYDPILVMTCAGFALLTIYVCIRAYPKLMKEAVEDYVRTHRYLFIRED